MNYKFRGLTEEGEWIYGSLIKRDRTKFTKDDIGYNTYIVDDNDKCSMMSAARDHATWKAYQVIPETVGQFTGFEILDTELYHNDYIGIYLDGERYDTQDKLIAIIEIVFEDNYKEYYFNFIKGDIHEVIEHIDINITTDYDLSLGQFMEWWDNENTFGKLEIIGNKYQNKELMNSQHSPQA